MGFPQPLSNVQNLGHKRDKMLLTQIPYCYKWMLRCWMLFACQHCVESGQCCLIHHLIKKSLLFIIHEITIHTFIHSTKITYISLRKYNLIQTCLIEVTKHKMKYCFQTRPYSTNTVRRDFKEQTFLNPTTQWLKCILDISETL